MSDLVPIQQVQAMATAIAKSGLFGIKTPEHAFALMLIAQAEGLHPATVARDYDIIAGRPAKKSEAMLRSFIESGGKVEWHVLTDSMASATFSHPSGGSVKIDWDMPRASNAGIAGKEMWKKYPRQMLRARCVSEGVRTVCPMATGGMYVPEEVEDFEKPQTKTVASNVIEKTEQAPNTPVSPKTQSTPTQTPNSTPKTAPVAKQTGLAGGLSVAQLARLFAIAGEHDWTHEQVKRYITDRWNLTSSKDLNRQQYDILVEKIENQTFETAYESIPEKF